MTREEQLKKIKDLLDQGFLDELELNKIISNAEAKSTTPSDVLDEYFKSHDISPNNSKLINRTLSDYGELYTFANATKTFSIDIKEYYNSSKAFTANIYQILKPSNLSIDCMRSIAQINIPTTTTIGIFENLMKLFLNDVEIGGSVKKGDVFAAGKTVEVKAPGARIGKGENIDVRDCNTALLDIIKDKYSNNLEKSQIDDIATYCKKDVFKSMIRSNTRNKVFEVLYNSSLDVHQIWDVLSTSLLAMFPNKAFNVSELISFESEIIKSKEDLLDDKFYSKLQRVAGTLQMMYYQMVDGWDCITIYKGRGSEDAIKSGEFISIPAKMFANLKDAYYAPILYAGGMDSSRSGGRPTHLCKIFSTGRAYIAN